MIIRHDTNTERRQRIEHRIYEIMTINKVSYETREKTYAAMLRAARERGEGAVEAMREVEMTLRKQVQS